MNIFEYEHINLSLSQNEIMVISGGKYYGAQEGTKFELSFLAYYLPY